MKQKAGGEKTPREHVVTCLLSHDSVYKLCSRLYISGEDISFLLTENEKTRTGRRGILKNDPDAGPQVLAGEDFKVAAVFVHDPFGNGKAETCSGARAHLVRTEKALKYVRQL